MSEAARITDPISHTASLGGMLGGLLVGALVGAALVVAGAATGGLAIAAVVAGTAAAGGGIGAVIGSMSFATSITGAIATGAANVFTNSLMGARAHLDTVLCSKHPPPIPIAQGSATVYINRMPAARVNDTCGCGGKIAKGSANVFIGGGTIQTDEISPEIPAWLAWTVMGVGVASAVILFGPIVAATGLLGSYLGDKGGEWLGGKIFGEGSDGQKWMGLGGGLAGGYAGFKGGGLLSEKLLPNPTTPLEGFVKGGVPEMQETQLNNLYGKAEDPTLVKDFEKNPDGSIVKNPDLQEVTPGNKPDLSGKDALGGDKKWLYAVDENGKLVVGSEDPVAGVTTPNGDPARLGHPTLTDGQPARIAGELHQNPDGSWYVDNNSGRYSQFPDRTPEKLDAVTDRFKDSGLDMSDPKFNPRRLP